MNLDDSMGQASSPGRLVRDEPGSKPISEGPESDIRPQTDEGAAVVGRSRGLTAERRLDVSSEGPVAGSTAIQAGVGDLGERRSRSLR
jgi:hypothetical protein